MTDELNELNIISNYDKIYIINQDGLNNIKIKYKNIIKTELLNNFSYNSLDDLKIEFNNRNIIFPKCLFDAEYQYYLELNQYKEYTEFINNIDKDLIELKEYNNENLYKNIELCKLEIKKNMEQFIILNNSIKSKNLPYNNTINRCIEQYNLNNFLNFPLDELKINIDNLIYLKKNLESNYYKFIQLTENNDIKNILEEKYKLILDKLEDAKNYIEDSEYFHDTISYLNKKDDLNDFNIFINENSILKYIFKPDLSIIFDLLDKFKISNLPDKLIDVKNEDKYPDSLLIENSNKVDYSLKQFFQTFIKDKIDTLSNDEFKKDNLIKLLKDNLDIIRLVACQYIEIQNEKDYITLSEQLSNNDILLNEQVLKIDKNLQVLLKIKNELNNRKINRNIINNELIYKAEQLLLNNDINFEECVDNYLLYLYKVQLYLHKMNILFDILSDYNNSKNNNKELLIQSEKDTILIKQKLNKLKQIELYNQYKLKLNNFNLELYKNLINIYKNNEIYELIKQKLDNISILDIKFKNSIINLNLNNKEEEIIENKNKEKVKENNEKDKIIEYTKIENNLEEDKVNNNIEDEEYKETKNHLEEDEEYEETKNHLEEDEVNNNIEDAEYKERENHLEEDNVNNNIEDGENKERENNLEENEEYEKRENIIKKDKERENNLEENEEYEKKENIIKKDKERENNLEENEEYEKRENIIKKDKENDNNIEEIIIRKNNLEYLCIVCNKLLKYKGSKPNIHLTTKLHTKNYNNWIKN